MANKALVLAIAAKFDDREIKKALGSLKSFGKVAGAAVGAAVVAGGVALAKFGVESIKAAENVSTANARIGQIAESMDIFGTQAQEVTDRLIAYAKANELTFAVDENVIKSTQAKLLTFRELALTADEAGGAFDRATQAAIDLAAAGFGSAEQNAVQLGKALQDPIKGITALARSGVTFTEQEKETIKTLVESGKTYEAQNLILQALETQVGGTAEATANASDKMSLAFQNIYEQVGEALLPAFEGMLPTITKDLAPALTDLAEQAVPLLIGIMDTLTQTIQDMGDPTTVLGGAMVELSENFGLFFDTLGTGSTDAENFSSSLGRIVEAINFLLVTLSSLIAGFQGVGYAIDALGRGDFAEVWRFLTTDTIEYADSVEAARAATEAANGGDLSELVSELDAVKIAAYDAATQTQKLSVAVDAVRPDFSRFGITPEVKVPVKLTPTPKGTAKKDPVADFLDKLKDDIAKQAAEIKLTDLGLSSALVEDILGSGADWDEIYDYIIKGGSKAADEIQNLFNEANGALEELGKTAEATEEQLGAMAQIQLDFYDRMVAKYEENQRQIAELNTAVQDTFNSFNQSSMVTESLGAMEQSVVDLTSALRETVAAQETSLISAKNQKKLQGYLDIVEGQMRSVAQQRDKLESELSEVKSVYKSFFDSIVGDVDITSFKGKSDSIIKQLRKQVEAQGKFQEDIKQLRASGLSDTALEQIQKAGVQAGGATAAALLTGGQGAIDEVNSLYAQLGDIATSATEAQLAPMYGAGVDLADGLIAGLEARQAELEAVATMMAVAFQTTFEKALGQGTNRVSAPVSAQEWAAFSAAYAQAQAQLIATLGPGEGVQYSPGDLVNGIQLPSQPVSSNPGRPGNITINLTAGMGVNGADVGRQIVDEIKKYERRSGQVFVPAVQAGLSV